MSRGVRYRFPDKGPVTFHFTVPVFFQFKNELDVVILKARSDMKMKVEDGLPGDPAVVGKNVETLQCKCFDCSFCDCMCGFQDPLEHRWREFKKVPAMAFRKDKGMAKVDWIDIEDAECVLVFEENFRIDLFADNTTEDAVVAEVWTNIHDRKLNYQKKPESQRMCS